MFELIGILLMPSYQINCRTAARVTVYLSG